MLIDIIAGARPNFMKIAPIISNIKNAQERGHAIKYRLIHTGQHYDKKMSQDFFEQLNIPLPDVNLGAGGGTQAEQTAAIMIGYEKVLLGQKPNLCLVVGDVTSTLACAITAQKMHIKVAHVEAGIRSRDWTMPEEINRLATDAVTNFFFTTTIIANQNLLETGVSPDDIFFVGNTMIDTLLKNEHRFTPPEIWSLAELKPQQYIVMTLHRPANVDQEKNLEDLLRAVKENAKDIHVVFPVHPRTAKTLKQLNMDWNSLHLIEPLSYLEFNYLVKHSLGVITDSGGITEETTVMGIPCMTLRTTTERPETVTIGTNELLGVDPKAIPPAMNRLLRGQWKKCGIPKKWDGKTSERIVNHIIELNKQGRLAY